VSFDRIGLLFAAPLFGVLLGGLGWWARGARLRAAAAWSPGAGAGSLADRWTTWLFAAAGIMGAIGLAGPRWGRSITELQGRSLNLAIGVDVSRSMLAEDVGPNRLGRAIAEAKRVVQDARGDRIALLAFTGRSYIMSPLTLDDAAIMIQLDGLDPDVASEGGTDLAAVLTQGTELLRAAAERGARAMVVFTDGETLDSVDAAIAAARAMRSAGISLIAVGVGDTTPVRIPKRDERGTLAGYQTHEGQTVYTWRRDDVLRAVVDAAGGVLITPPAADPAGTIRRVLEGLERGASRELHREDLTPRAWLFGLGAFLLLGLQGWLRRGPAVAGIALLLSPWNGASAQPPSRGNKLLQAHDTLQAASAFATEAARGSSPDTAWFNAGTAALVRARFPEAKQWLGIAARSLDPDLRFRALFNLGLVAYHEALRDTARRAELHSEAAARFREALLLHPGSVDTKWNLELVTAPQPPPSRGGGGGATPPNPQQARPSGSAIAQSDADQILNSVERAEREVRAEQARRRRLTQTRSGKDW
jgi:Ca-activated chloride channel family protein